MESRRNQSSVRKKILWHRDLTQINNCVQQRQELRFLVREPKSKLGRDEVREAIPFIIGSSHDCGKTISPESSGALLQTISYETSDFGWQYNIFTQYIV
jgi:hypothetical protein